MQSDPPNLMGLTSCLHSHLWIPVLLVLIFCSPDKHSCISRLFVVLCFHPDQCRERSILDSTKVILHGSTDSTPRPFEISQSADIDQGDQGRERHSCFLMNFFSPSPSGGTQLSGPQKQEVKGPCCSYKEILKIQKLIGV